MDHRIIECLKSAQEADSDFLDYRRTAGESIDMSVQGEKNLRKIVIAIAMLALILPVIADCGESVDEPVTPENGADETEILAPITDIQPVYGDIEPDLLLKNGLSEAEDVTPLYRKIEITGTVLPMDLIFSRRDLETLAEYGAAYPSLAGLTVTARWNGREMFGLDLHKLLELCGDDLSLEQRLNVAADGKETKCGFTDDTQAVLVLAENGSPVEAVCMMVGGEHIDGADRIMLGSCCDDPHYEMHNRPPHDQSADIAFIFNIYEADGGNRTVTYTTAALEDLALENPDAVHGSYYGIIGDRESIPTMGSGGYLDYYEGLRLDWLLKEELGLTLNGRAELYGREGELYAEIADLQYFAMDAAEYYSCESNGAVINGMALPVLAYSKNGAPLLPEHEHESEAYISANPVKMTLKEMGIDSDVGTVKNHSGPFVAALGNCTGFYGGYQTETAGDCVRMDIYLN